MKIMRSPSRLTIAIAVTLVTMTVCAIGIRAELVDASYSISDHFPQSKQRTDDVRALAAARGRLR
jgi:hypothetical protein